VAPLKVEVVPFGPASDEVEAMGAATLDDPEVRRRLEGSDYRVLSVAPLDAGPEAEDGAGPTPVQTTVYDYTNERTLVIESGKKVAVRETVRQPLPTLDELRAAERRLRADPKLGAGLKEKKLQTYRPMPPLVLDELPDGRVERTVALGVRPANGRRGRHEIVGVKLATGEVVRFEGGAPRGGLAKGAQCGVSGAGQPTTPIGTPGRAKVTVTRGGEVLWTFVAVRPAVSSGTNGSGVELRQVAYRGKQVFRRAHVPILNVRYRNDACGPFRDWQNEEGRFKANGANVAPGFKLCPNKAETILESSQDQGNFRGVAIYVDGEEVVVVSELEAGWYRYISRWRLHANGEIRPRFGFGAVRASCVCNKHHHHAYWRFDFDIAGAGHNEVGEFNDPALSGPDKWHTLTHEIRRKRNKPRKRRWRVRNTQTGESYSLIPGDGDGAADSFGIGDLWALRHRPGQIDDGIGFTTNLDEARAHLNQFVNGEPITDTDVVLWYAGHFTHDLHEHEVGHIVGPLLRPHDW
jgi:hypothetical protein